MPSSPIVFNAPNNSQLIESLSGLSGGIGGILGNQQRRKIDIEEGTIVGNAMQEIAKNPNAGIADVMSLLLKAGLPASKASAHAQAYAKNQVDLSKSRAYNAKADESQRSAALWEEINQGRGGGISPGGNIPQNNAYPEEPSSVSETPQGPKVSNEPPNEGTIKPRYASDQVDPRFFSKDLSKFEATRLAESEKGYKHHEKYLTTLQEQAYKQPFIQESIRQALNNVASGNVSGAASTIRSKLGKIFPSALTVEERNLETNMKNIALDEFASTPGFRSQGEFFVLTQVLPKLGDRKKSQELTLKALLDSSIMKKKEEEIALDVINKSPNYETPLNLIDIVNDRMNQEWKKLYARRYAEDPKIWDEYIKKNPNDPLFKDIEKTAVPPSSIDWNEYVTLQSPEGQKVAVHKSKLQKRIQQGWKEVKDGKKENR